MKAILIILISSFFCQVSIAQNYASWNYQAECVDATISNATKVRITIFDKVDINMFKKMAVHAVLVKGAVGGSSCINQPPILKQTDIDANNSYFKKLFGKNAYYYKFIISVEEIDSKNFDKNKIKQKDEHSAVVTINKDLLRKDLINDKIIKPVTDGF